MIQHTTAYYFDIVQDKGGIVNVIRGCSKFNILLFIMVSGAMMLSREIPIKKMWGKYILRIGYVFLFWSFLYTSYNAVVEYNHGVSWLDILKDSIGSFVSGGTVRLWYLVMLIGLYAIVPLVYQWYVHADKKGRIYGLIIIGVVTSVFDSLSLIEPISTLFGLDFGRIASVFPGISVFYLILGVFLVDYSDELFRSTVKKTVISVIGLFALIVTGVIHYFREDTLGNSFIGYLPVCLLLFMIAKISVSRLSKHFMSALRIVADCTFGIYLFHTFIQYLFHYCGIESFCFGMSAIPGIVLYWILLLLVSFVLVFFMRRVKIGRLFT